MKLVKAASELHVGLPALIMTRCGLELWRLDKAHEQPARPSQRRPVRLALERRSVTIVVGPD